MGKIKRAYKREKHYPAPLVLHVAQETKDELEAHADAQEISLSAAARQALTTGLAAIRRKRQ